MNDLTPTKNLLDPIEVASRDEISALQYHRMRRSLAHAYENSPFYRKRFDEYGVHPSDLKTLADLSKFPFHPENGPQGHLPLWHVCRSSGKARAGSWLFRHHR